ncbi:MAG: DUF447 domain-containing protein [Halobacteriaceae archaeon]
MSDGDAAAWPAAFEGVVETVVTTRGPNGRWNVAALGVHAGAPVTARTWGRTRTRRNFEREGGGYVQFVTDPVLFVDAALSVRETDDPVLADAAAWVRVSVDRRDSGTEDGTEWVAWALTPVESAVVETSVPTLDRGTAAVVEATVAASRLGVRGFEDDRLRARLEYFADVADRCGGPRVAEAMDRVASLADWRRGGNESF